MQGPCLSTAMALSLLSQTRLLGSYRPTSSNRTSSVPAVEHAQLVPRLHGFNSAPIVHRHSTRGRDLRIRAIESPSDVAINVQNEEASAYTIIDVEGNRWGVANLLRICREPYDLLHD